MNNQRLLDNLTKLKLITVRDKLDNLLDTAVRKEMSHLETIAYLCEQEICSKNQRRIQLGINISKLPYVRTLEQFDYKEQPSIDPKQIRDLSTCR